MLTIAGINRPVDYLTSDQHFGHERMAGVFGREYEGRLDEMNAMMLERWNAVVKPEDTVLHLGDFAMGIRAENLPLTQHLNGTILLMPGNHDSISLLQDPGYAQRQRPLYEEAFDLILPETGDRLGEGAAVWHDCSERALILEQLPNGGATDLSPFGMRLEVFGFAGSFLSLSIDLPESALQGLTRSHVLRLETGIIAERALEVYARLNIGHGPNTDQATLQLRRFEPGHYSRQVTEFDLAYTPMNEKRLEKIWLDLIFEGPQMNQFVLRDVTVSRRPRAEL